ncbi:MAG TPA: class I SAM-dependent methyltransferase [Burkholderiaceae bacterium]|jgi:SAM-dependent methyltransferase
MTIATKKNEWDQSYDNRDNYVFYPHEEVIRFVSKFIRKRIGLNEFRDVSPEIKDKRVLDLGCGIGRHVIYCQDMGLEAYGIDLSDVAVDLARKWGQQNGLHEPEQRIRQGDVRHLPWDKGFFRYAVSHGVLDSMPFEIARAACVELARVMPVGGLFYCDLISGDDSKHAREFSGEEIVNTAHEHGTIQLYFNLAKIQSMIEGVFEIDECNLVRRENILRGGYTSRYHLVLKRI